MELGEKLEAVKEACANATQQIIIANNIPIELWGVIREWTSGELAIRERLERINRKIKQKETEEKEQEEKQKQEEYTGTAEDFKNWIEEKKKGGETL